MNMSNITNTIGMLERIRGVKTNNLLSGNVDLIEPGNLA